MSLVDPVKRVPGVGDVQVFGAGRYAMRIWLDTTKMAAQNISVGEVQSAIQAQNTVIPGGQIGAEPAPPGTEFTYSIQTKGRLQTAEEFGNIIIRAEGNKLLYLKDIAKVELGSQTYNVSSKYNGRDSGRHRPCTPLPAPTPSTRWTLWSSSLKTAPAASPPEWNTT